MTDSANSTTLRDSAVLSFPSLAERKGWHSFDLVDIPNEGMSVFDHRWLDANGPPVRIALVMLTKTAEQLQTAIAELDSDPSKGIVDGVLEDFESTADCLGALSDMVRAAHARVMLVSGRADERPVV
jgi:hypothetical protein